MILEGIQKKHCDFNYLMVKFAAIGGQRYVKSVYPDNIEAVYTEKQMITRKP